MITETIASNANSPRRRKRNKILHSDSSKKENEFMLKLKKRDGRRNILQVMISVLEAIAAFTCVLMTVKGTSQSIVKVSEASEEFSPVLQTSNKVDWEKFPSQEDIDFFKTNGYVLLKNIIPPKIAKTARRSILADLRDNYDPDERELYEHSSYAQDLLGTPTLSDMYQKTPFLSAIQSLMGQIDMSSLEQAQVCVHFPTDPEHGIENDTPFAPDYVSEAHIDGVPTMYNSLIKYRPFTALVGVALSDELDDFEGNLVVYPGSHKKTADVLRQRRDSGRNLWLNKRKNSKMYPDGVIDDIEPLQLRMSFGDAFIAHHLLVHRVVENREADVRIHVHWRVKHKDHVHGRQDYSCDVWSGFDAIEED